jgi:hypothetical protein
MNLEESMAVWVEEVLASLPVGDVFSLEMVWGFRKRSRDL